MNPAGWGSLWGRPALETGSTAPVSSWARYLIFPAPVYGAFTPVKRDVRRSCHPEVACAFPQVPLVKGRRCVVLADGFYEWQRRQASNHRQPYFIYFPQIGTQQVAAAAAVAAARPPSGSRAFRTFGWVSFLFFFKFSAISCLFRFPFCPIISSFWESRYTRVAGVTLSQAPRCFINFILFPASQSGPFLLVCFQVRSCFLFTPESGPVDLGVS